mmetsp:Transcript_29931/g.72884  ORF Transcript_29931/g.72884 Transcript_29931/m.72884 type:complete len:263 (+) Transcript_29931:52-840(+)
MRAWLLLLLLLSASHSPAHAKKRRRAKRPAADAAPPPPDAALELASRHHHRGVMAHVQGDLRGATREFTAAIDAKPDFAYAYFRLGFVLQEQQEAKRQQGGTVRRAVGAAGAEEPADAPDEPIRLFRWAVRLDPRDEMAYHALGKALRDAGRLEEANSTYISLATQVNPQSAHAYWGMGKVGSLALDEFDADPDDPADPSRFYAIAAKLQPKEFQLDGTRVRQVEPKTPEREAKIEQEAKERREQFVRDLNEGNQKMKYAGD